MSDIKIVEADPPKENTPLESAIYQVMGVDPSEQSKYQEKAQVLLDYAKGETQDCSPENLKRIIRSLELKIGSPPLSERRIDYITRYAYLALEEKKLKKDKG